MKTIIITILSFFLMLIGCASEKELLNNYDIEIAQASYEHWSNRPPIESDVRERGTDLRLVIENWPEGADPMYIIYRKMKSFPVEIADRSETMTTLEARIIRSSAVMSETSERIDATDRLVFKDENGEIGFIEIKEWERMSDS